MVDFDSPTAYRASPSTATPSSETHFIERTFGETRRWVKVIAG